MMRWIALDIGDARIGVAVSDETGLIAQPIGRIDRVGWGPDIRAIAAYAERYATRAIVCGLPLKLSGTRGAQAEKNQAFIERLKAEGFQVEMWDERLSTATAERALIEGNMRRDRRRETIDQVAAAVILQAFLDAKRSKEGDEI